MFPKQQHSRSPTTSAGKREPARGHLSSRLENTGAPSRGNGDKSRSTDDRIPQAALQRLRTPREIFAYNRNCQNAVNTGTHSSTACDARCTACTRGPNVLIYHLPTRYMEQRYRRNARGHTLTPERSTNTPVRQNFKNNRGSVRKVTPLIARSASCHHATSAAPPRREALRFPPLQSGSGAASLSWPARAETESKKYQPKPAI